MAVPEQVSPVRLASPKSEKAWACCPSPPREADHVSGREGGRAGPHPADATGWNVSYKAGPSFPPHWLTGLSLRAGAASPSRLRDNGSDVTDVTEGGRRGRVWPKTAWEPLVNAPPETPGPPKR